MAPLLAIVTPRRRLYRGVQYK